MKNIFSLKSAKAVFIGACGGIAASVVMIFIFAWILFASPISEGAADAAVLAITAASAFFAGFLCAKINKSQGMLLGALSGAVYLLIIYIASCFFAARADFGAVCISTAVLAVISSALGGIIGVNIKKKSK